MKDFRNYIIIALGIIVLLIWFFPPKSTPTKDIKSRIDSAVLIHQKRIIIEQAVQKKLLVKIKTDSANRTQEKFTYESKIAKLKNDLAKARYTGNSKTISQDSINIALQALSESPIKDSIITVLEARVDTLTHQADQLVIDYSKVIESNVIEKEEIKQELNLRLKEIDELTTELKKQRGKKIKTALIALLVGFGIGEVVH